MDELTLTVPIGVSSHDTLDSLDEEMTEYAGQFPGVTHRIVAFTNPLVVTRGQHEVDFTGPSVSITLLALDQAAGIPRTAEAVPATIEYLNDHATPAPTTQMPPSRTSYLADVPHTPPPFPDGMDALAAPKVQEATEAAWNANETLIVPSLDAWLGGDR
jgi:hypothetical protein